MRALKRFMLVLAEHKSATWTNCWRVLISRLHTELPQLPEVCPRSHSLSIVTHGLLAAERLITGLPAGGQKLHLTPGGGSFIGSNPRSSPVRERNVADLTSTELSADRSSGLCPCFGRYAHNFSDDKVGLKIRTCRYTSENSRSRSPTGLTTSAYKVSSRQTMDPFGAKAATGAARTVLGQCPVDRCRNSATACPTTMWPLIPQ